MVKNTVRVIPDDSEILWRVEEYTSGAHIVAAPVLMRIPSHVGLAVSEAIAINSD